MGLVAFSVVFFGSVIGVSHLIVGNVDDVVIVVVVHWVGIFLFSVDVSFSQCSEGMSPSGDPQIDVGVLDEPFVDDLSVLIGMHGSVIGAEEVSLPCAEDGMIQLLSLNGSESVLVFFEDEQVL